MTTSLERDAPVAPAVNLWSGVAFLVAVLGLAGSLYASLGMNLKACPLCFYQRTFMMSVVAVLGVGLLSGLGRTGRLGLLALPLAVAGLGVAGFHVYLEMSGNMECPLGLFGVGTVPQQSLGAFTLLTALLLLDVGGGRWGLLVVGVVLGVALTIGSVIANPPLPAPPDEPYAEALDICRPPHRAP